MIRRFIALLIGAALLTATAGCDSQTKEEKPKGSSAVNSEMLLEESPLPTLYPEQAYAQLKNDTQAWGLKKEKGKAPDIADATVRTLDNFGAVYLAKDKGKTLYLTFDEGYENGYTPQILDVLKQTQVPAAFFITGDYLDKEPGLVKRMTEEGHIVGNHTVNHPSMPSVTNNEKLADEITKLDDSYFALTGQHMKYIRPPKGEYSERTLAISKDLGYKTVLWSFAYVDWDKDKSQGADHAYNQVMPYLHDGAILLLHAVSKDNAEALKRIITDAQAQGYTFRSLNEL